MILSRRHLLLGLGAVVCAPAIVRAASLMPVRAWVDGFTWVEETWPWHPGMTLTDWAVAYIAKTGDLKPSFSLVPISPKEFYHP